MPMVVSDREKTERNKKKTINTQIEIKCLSFEDSLD